MGYSIKCADEHTYWHGPTQKCVPCRTKAGHEVTPNCGFDDRGSRFEFPLKTCPNNTFNSDDSSPVCTACTVCSPGSTVLSSCTSVSDTRCSGIVRPTAAVSPTVNKGSTSVASRTLAPTTLAPTTLAPTTLAPTTLAPTTSAPTTLSRTSWPNSPPVLLYAGLIGCLLFVSLSVFAYVVFRTTKKDRQRLRWSKRPSVKEEGFFPLFTTDGNNDLEQILSPGILSAPLQMVLDNLDVLEQLVILLDPEIQGVKNTKHLASHCCFSSTWITYTYSMKESKSPLKAVLEGVTTRQPDWTVGHLAKLLRLIERNDAVDVLTKLRLKPLLPL